jgi:hypothetical protein
MGEITRKRLEGNATDADVSELNTLDYDKKALQEALAGASQTAALLDPSGLRDQHSNVVADWGKHVSEAQLKALASVVQSREKELVDALTKLIDYASVSGIQNMTDVWRPSEQLQNAFLIAYCSMIRHRPRLRVVRMAGISGFACCFHVWWMPIFSIRSVSCRLTRWQTGPLRYAWKRYYSASTDIWQRSRRTPDPPS